MNFEFKTENTTELWTGTAADIVAKLKVHGVRVNTTQIANMKPGYSMGKVISFDNQKTFTLKCKR